MAEKRKCKFNDDLRKEYPFIKQMKPGNFSDVHCLHCESTFSIAHGGKSDIKDHIKTKKHLRAESAASCSEKLSSYFSPKISGKEQLILAAKEGVHAFHSVMHNHSFRSSDCTAQLTRKLYETKFSCGRTKTEAIISKILAPDALEDLKSEIEKCHFVSLSTDTSNHKDQKIVPVMVRYFLPQDGVKVKLLELKELPGETADILSENMFDVIEKHNLNKKIVAFGADNTNTMMGGSKQNGVNNVLIKLKMKYGSHIIGIGCTAHIIHNAAQIAVDQLPIDIESIVIKIYKYFWIYTVRVERLKYFCDFVQSDYKKILGYSSTRWLALLPSVRLILDIFEALKAFFLSGK